MKSNSPNDSMTTQQKNDDNKNKKKRKRSNTNRPCPQPGDQNYKTPTQLRNARKRRKKQRDRHSNDKTKEADREQRSSSSSTTVEKPSSDRTKSQKKKSTTKASSSSTTTTNKKITNDPSLKYISNPKAAPTVQAAIRFFKSIPIHESSTNDDDKDNPKMLYHTFPVSVGSTTGWRSVARLAVRNNSKDDDESKQLRIGLFLPGTHELLEVPGCQAHHPLINHAVERIQKLCHQLNIQAFNEHTGTGNLRYLSISIELSTQKQQIVLVWKDDEGDNRNKSLENLIRSLIETSEGSNDDDNVNLHSLWVHHNNSWKHSNSIFDRSGTWEQKYGPENGRMEEIPLPDITTFHPTSIKSNKQLNVPLYFPPQVFRQANLPAFCKIVLKIREWLRQRLQSKTIDVDNQHKKKKISGAEEKEKYHQRLGHCLELYGGVGTIGLHLIDLFDSLESSDENPYNKDCFESSVRNITINNKPLSISTQDKITYQSKSATDMVVQTDKVSNANVIIVDPPRKGLDAEVLDALCAEYAIPSVPREQVLIYISCGFDAFRRDFNSLTASGKWKLNVAEGHILFPGSDAIETLAFFTRDR
jgi:tRNA/tmRNA/rRNA uracil-C5-methylase (TrmA/RlmC/RlmD family)